MRLARAIYYSLLGNKKILNVGNILFNIDGRFCNLEEIPDSYLKKVYGFTKDELLDMITAEIEWENVE
jgi:hypothetical protein